MSSLYHDALKLASAQRGGELEIERMKGGSSPHKKIASSLFQDYRGETRVKR